MRRIEYENSLQDAVYYWGMKNSIKLGDAIKKLLLKLCYAVASAQVELVTQSGVVVDSKEHKLRKLIANRLK